jgi:hypothetical protein
VPPAASWLRGCFTHLVAATALPAAAAGPVGQEAEPEGAGDAHHGEADGYPGVRVGQGAARFGGAFRRRVCGGRWCLPSSQRRSVRRTEGTRPLSLIVPAAACACRLLTSHTSYHLASNTLLPSALGGNLPCCRPSPTPPSSPSWTALWACTCRGRPRRSRRRLPGWAHRTHAAHRNGTARAARRLSPPAPSLECCDC